MSISFFNPILLLGLLGIALPILIHLLSRKNVKVVEWGAMQFLELGKRTRRKYQLEHLLLLLLRILLICLICCALARPWMSGVILFSAETQRDPRALLIVLDSSLSMDRRDVNQKPIDRAKEIIRDILDEAHPGDQFYLLAARDVPQKLLPGWTSEPEQVRTALNELPPASGSANLPLTLIHAVQQFQEIDQLQREILILSDNQAASWHPQEEQLWQRLQNLYQITSIPPRIWSILLLTAEENAKPLINSGLETPALSRETTVSNRPLQITTTARHFGAEERTRTVHLSIDGQRLSQQSREIRMAPASLNTLSFDYLPTTPGAHLITLEWESDDWPGDDQVHSVLEVRSQVSVQFIEQNIFTDPTLMESFYLSTALTAAQQRATNILRDNNLIDFKVKQTLPEDLDALADCDVLCLANLPLVSEKHVRLLRQYLQQGGNLLLLLGDQTRADRWNETIFHPEDGLLSLKLNQIKTDPQPSRGGIHLEDRSLESGWLKPFRAEELGGLTEAIFSQWWSLQIPETADGNKSGRLQTDLLLKTGDPWLITGTVANGQIAIVTTPLNATWSNLPTKPDYVPFVHELLLSLFDHQSRHILTAGQPIIQEFKKTDEFDPAELDYEITSPAGVSTPVRLNQEDRVLFDQTATAGIYRLEGRGQFDNPDEKPKSSEDFVVGFDPTESNPISLTEAEETSLRRDYPWQVHTNWQELQSEMLTSTGRTEITTWLLLLFVIFLLGEQFFTHYLVRDAHELEAMHESEPEVPAVQQEDSA
ncbi:hypothetical protein Pla110_13190 [Polystyrenella longa]|uniref:VWFA domain-containing protein n=1 Tax=Polystyrenella longa TaxID=2528007 RepID=A0A518CK51_9PLAN|nr:BatA domain-containing protein [Polystyrenella longa]QDU79608.1 hypothetical protein Pla110_13190 [Polystyrenella longa]